MRCQIQGAPSAMKSTLSAALRPICRAYDNSRAKTASGPRERAVDDRGPRLRRSPVVADDVQDEELRFLPVGMESVAPPSSSWGHASCASHGRGPRRGRRPPASRSRGPADRTPRSAGPLGPAQRSDRRSSGRVLISRAMPSERSCACAVGQRAEHGDRAACIGGQLRRAPVVDAQHHQGGVESRPPLRPTGRVSRGSTAS